MRSFISFILIVLCTVNCAQDKRPLRGETNFQRELNALFKDATTSPLKDKDRKDFRGLDFFSFDSTFVVKANLTRTPDEMPFKMKTTDGRLPEYVKYGVVEFEIRGEQYALDIYRNLENVPTKGHGELLFLPFIDHTNGDTTYGGGRYIDVSIPKGDILEIDFNRAYNPYCAYDEKYSCPIVPRQNYLPIEVRAGVKAFKKE
jgi:uncharacterized protein (DUF1684 family)